MARMTVKHQKLQYEADERAAIEVAKIEYSYRFRKVLSEALLENFEISAVSLSGVYTIYDRGESMYTYVYDSYQLDVDVLDDLEFEINKKKNKRLVALKKIELMKSAIAKLTNEERIALLT